MLSAFRKKQCSKHLHTVRTICIRQKCTVPNHWYFSTSYHTPGTQLTGNAIKHAEATVLIDDKLVSNVFVADIDEAKNHYDVRSEYSTQMGNALAYTFDQNVAAMVAKAARTATNFNTDLPGGTQINITAASNAKANITGAQLATALFSAAQKMDENDVPRMTRLRISAPRILQIGPRNQCNQPRLGRSRRIRRRHRASGCWH